MRGLKDKVVIVTGGGGGIGSATCHRFAQEGAKVAVFDINEATAKSVAGAIEEAGGVARAFACDITDHEAVETAVAAAEAALGPVTVLVNNAGWDVFRLFKDTTPADWQKLIAINLIGPLNMTHVVLPGMLRRRAGRVVSIASDAARVGSSGEAVYAACKAGMLGLSKTLAREHARAGLTFNVVCPGATNTNLFAEYKKGAGNPEKLEDAFRRAVPMGRIGEPEDLPGAILFFASDDAAFITGQVLSVSGGLTMAG
ncbi:SDR family NAD(P)-dependent oxidoreductase [Rhodopila sp.]|jgi:2-hydroxycyclohexanecarboxyl-CoA dehydrogenase|uniref:SDR family NAD(P)-dependent oxidoreductase n=1 Tax=Rhodopila sp. TaxID=2480087 RepID=UPI002C7CAD8D|nr:glucose 1-dehydrogenase [Rhodopila sp.]HVZ09736.1 glucose 1-dehydrogenase [Rhodopila sp.]